MRFLLLEGNIMKKLLTFIFQKLEISVVNAQTDQIIKLKSIINDQSKTIAFLKKESSDLSQQFYTAQNMADTHAILDDHLDKLINEQIDQIKRLENKCIELTSQVKSLENIVEEKDCLLTSHTRLIEKYQSILESRRK